ncbi:hypothetical protein HHI36_008900 [Cryptolaemus montrouzieri]|uniref:Uncharacterized protein n=1 Tax=Cryptolaemus montrouzieri TaxID=559131 RepID=A0ABD2MUA5_9CUCU
MGKRNNIESRRRVMMKLYRKCHKKCSCMQLIIPSIERVIADHFEEEKDLLEEENLEEEEPRPRTSSKPKNEIIWRKHLQFEPPQFINLKFPRIRWYWDSNLDIKMFSENMARDRFFPMRNNFHVIGNNTIPQNDTDSFIKVRSLYDSVRKQCLE